MVKHYIYNQKQSCKKTRIILNFVEVVSKCAVKGFSHPIRPTHTAQVLCGMCGPEQANYNVLCVHKIINAKQTPRGTVC